MTFQKPKSFYDLPYRVQENLLWRIELEYDSYESSKDETINNILNGGDSNQLIIKNYYQALSEDSLFEISQEVLDSLESGVRTLVKFMKGQI